MCLLMANNAFPGAIVVVAAVVIAVAAASTAEPCSCYTHSSFDSDANKCLWDCSFPHDACNRGTDDFTELPICRDLTLTGDECSCYATGRYIRDADMCLTDCPGSRGSSTCHLDGHCLYERCDHAWERLLLLEVRGGEDVSELLEQHAPVLENALIEQFGYGNVSVYDVNVTQLRLVKTTYRVYFRAFGRASHGEQVGQNEELLAAIQNGLLRAGVKVVVTKVALLVPDVSLYKDANEREDVGIAFVAALCVFGVVAFIVGVFVETHRRLGASSPLGRFVIKVLEEYRKFDEWSKQKAKEEKGLQAKKGPENLEPPSEDPAIDALPVSPAMRSAADLDADTKACVACTVSTSSSALCSVCLSSPAECAVVPCGHRCGCFDCLEVISKTRSPDCPVCRGPVQSILRIYDVSPTLGV